MFIIPKIFHSKGPLFRRLVNPKMKVFIIPKIRYSEGPLFQKSVIPKQWRHQDLKSGGARRGQRLIMGGGGKHVRVAHIASAKREPIFFGQTCARSAHSERVSASRFFLGGQTCARSERVSASRFWVGSRGPP